MKVAAIMPPGRSQTGLAAGGRMVIKPVLSRNPADTGDAHSTGC